MWGFFKGDFSDAGNPEVIADDVVYSIVNRENPKLDKKIIKIGFDKGVPNSIDGENLSLASILKLLNKLLGDYGYGIIDYVESSVYGVKIRQTMEDPGALCLIKAHQDLERLTLTKRQLSIKPYIEQRWGELVFEGLFFDDACKDMMSFIDSSQKYCTGEVLVEVRPYSIECMARSSPFSLYESNLYDYENKLLDHSKGEAFAELWGRGTVLSVLKRNQY